MKRVACSSLVLALAACSSLPDAGNGIVELQLDSARYRR